MPRKIFDVFNLLQFLMPNIIVDFVRTRINIKLTKDGVNLKPIDALMSSFSKFDIFDAIFLRVDFSVDCAFAHLVDCDWIVIGGGETAISILRERQRVNLNRSHWRNIPRASSSISTAHTFAAFSVNVFAIAKLFTLSETNFIPNLWICWNGSYFSKKKKLKLRPTDIFFFWSDRLFFIEDNYICNIQLVSSLFIFKAIFETGSFDLEQSEEGLIEELELCNLTGKLPFLSIFSEMFDGR